jgi:uncharacterized protein (TIGR04255 family)
MVKKTQRPALPDFERPPLHEVVLGIYFEELGTLTGTRIGSFWERIRGRYPKAHETNPVPHQTEDFGPPKRRQIEFEFDQITKIRTWLLTESEEMFVQFQRDFVGLNWRDLHESGAYPRYEKLKEEYREVHKNFDSFVTTESLGKLNVDQVEVTYVNLIMPAEGVWSSHEQADSVFRFVSRPPQFAEIPGQLEWLKLGAAFQLVNSVGEPIGRLRVNADPQFHVKRLTPLYRLTLTARGRPLGDGLAGVLAFMDTGRESIVRAFAALTTPEMHKVWGRLDA